MNNKNNICYVFSQATLDMAISEWVEQNIESNPKEKEQYLIVAAAIPWFLKHLNQSSSIFMFSSPDLLEEMKTWKESQEADYPHQKERIETTCDQLLEFFQSTTVIKHKMTVQA